MAQNEDYKKAEKLCKSSLLSFRMTPDWYDSCSDPLPHVKSLVVQAYIKGHHADALQRLLQGHSDTSV